VLISGAVEVSREEAVLRHQGQVTRATGDGPIRKRSVHGPIRWCVVNDDPGGLDRVAANELLFLRLAKRTLAARYGGDVPFADFACECTNDACDLRVEMTVDHYDPIRASGSRFVVAPRDEHVDLATETIVEWHQFYWVVERRLNAELLDFFSSGRHRASHLSLVASGPVELEEVYGGPALATAPALHTQVDVRR
jgi:hypothetical protein